MKKHILFGAIAGMLFLSSCDEVDNPVIDYGSYRNDLYGPPPTFTPLAAAEQRVLLEDFTGHDCGNCPAAHQIAKEISETHGDHVAVVAVHAGSLAEPFGQFPADWRTPEGEYYLLTQIGSDLLPTGRVNRVGGAGNELAPPTWSTNTDAELSSSAPVDLQIASSYDLTNQHLNVHVNTQWFESLTGNYKLVILVTQDSIVAPQLNYAADPEYIPEYVHRHMLRT